MLYVDPHVATIWEKVKELSSRKPKGSMTQNEPAAPSPAVPVTRAEIPTEDEVVSPTTSKEADTVTAIVTEWTEPASPIESTVSSASSDRSQDFEFRTSSSTATSLSEDVTQIPDITGPSLIIPEPFPTTHEGEVEDDLDLDEFARELGLDDSASAQAAETVVPPPVQTESEEEKADRLRKRLEETAAKRADIMSRCSNWESDLRELIKTSKKSLRKTLVAMRKAATVELKESKKVRGAIEELMAEAEKYLKGAAAYLKTLKKEGKTNTIKVNLWDKVIDKVDGKFNDRLKDTEGVLKMWHMHILDQEVQEVDICVCAIPLLLH